MRAQVAQAELELSYTKIYAPESGRITRKSIEEGALVQVGQPLLAIVPGDVWVTANFKESQIGRMTPGQHVDISVDAYPDKIMEIWKLYTTSLAGGGSLMNLFPVVDGKALMPPPVAPAGTPVTPAPVTPGVAPPATTPPSTTPPIVQP